MNNYILKIDLEHFKKSSTYINTYYFEMNLDGDTLFFKTLEEAKKYMDGYNLKITYENSRNDMYVEQLTLYNYKIDDTFDYDSVVCEKILSDDEIEKMENIKIEYSH